MRKLYILTFAMTFFAATTVLGQISGSAHDFSNENWNNSGEICIVCHTPHNADVTVTDAPLWNHEVTTATFTLYSSATLDAAVGQPDGSSKLCLSCHDGTVAVDNFGGRTNGNEFVSGDELIGTDLSDDHPVSFVYDATLASTDGGLYDPTTTNSGLGGTIDDDLLIGNKVQCASCHDVHNGSGVADLLRKSNAQSAFCLTCHNK
ncbi:MAG TPA: cytochrome C [Caldithrix abyssi]|uniref:Cytochrome C n=1 Tax=Caldithrix abyssi TaxID=187145 RepID=A0A7V1M097_CALAY|nr:cytochrome C [Caldithrix abyssi]